MTRLEFNRYIKDTYDITYDLPFEEDFDTWVYRHPENRKWFGILMTVSKRKLGLDSDELIDLVNVKCAQEIIDDMWKLEGVYPAYHMNKRHWLTLCLDGSCPDDTIKWLVKISYDLTKAKITKNKKIP